MGGPYIIPNNSLHNPFPHSLLRTRQISRSSFRCSCRCYSKYWYCCAGCRCDFSGLGGPLEGNGFSQRSPSTAFRETSCAPAALEVETSSFSTKRTWIFLVSLGAGRPHLQVCSKVCGERGAKRERGKDNQKRCKVTLGPQPSFSHWKRCFILAPCSLASCASPPKRGELGMGQKMRVSGLSSQGIRPAPLPGSRPGCGRG